MELETIKLSELKKLEQNVRTHGSIQIKELKRSVEQFGQTRAIVVDEDNNILIGNGLYMALCELGWETCQCYRKTGLSEKDKKKLILSDNRVFSLGADDYDGIDLYLNEITSLGDFDIAGFDEDILKETNVIEEDDLEIAVSGAGGFSLKDKPIECKPVPTKEEVSDNEDEELEYEHEELEHEENSENIYSENKETVKVDTYAKSRKSIICPSCGEVIYID